TIKPVTMTLSLSPSSVLGGNTSTGVVTLTAPAPPAGFSISLQSGNTTVATVPVSVTIPGGQSKASFTISTSVVTVLATSVISATLPAGATVNSTLQVRPVSVVGVNFAPAALSGGHTTVMTVQLDGPASAAGVTVNLSSTNSTIAGIPSSVVIASG